MFVLPSSVLWLYAFAVILFSLESSAQINEVHANASCAPYETQCPTGCCPFAQAECCIDGICCCPHGKTCIPYLCLCMGIETENEKPVLVSDKASPIRNSITACPSGTTTCGKDKCCPFPNAVCCTDGDHCCPYGYKCDLMHRRCLKTFGLVGQIPSSNVVDLQYQDINQMLFKSCPGGFKQCPSYLSCCLNDDGDWGCCPNPSRKVSWKDHLNYLPLD